MYLKKKPKKKKGYSIDPPELPPEEGPVPVEDPKPEETPQIDIYEEDRILISFSNRTASDLETKHIFEIIERQTSFFNELEGSIEAVTITRDKSHKTVDDLVQFLMVARSHRGIVQRRLDSHISLKAEASLTKLIIRGRKDQNIDGDVYETLMEFNQELDILNESIEKDLEGRAKITARIQKLEKSLVEACLKIQLESDSLRSFQHCKIRLFGTIKLYKALLVLPALVPREDLIPVEDPEPEEIPTIDSHNSEPGLLSLSNRIATDEEKKHILEIIQRQNSLSDQLEESIKMATIICSGFQATMDNLEQSLMAAKSHRVIIQRRIDSQTNIEAEASFTEQLIRQKKNVYDDSHYEAQVEFHRELATVREMIERDIQALETITLRIEKLEKDLVEASRILQLETKSLKSSKRCQALIYSAVTRYKALLHRGRDLPNELLIKIFGFAVDSDIDLIRSGQYEPRTFTVLKLSSICVHWRYIVHEVPYLWHYIPVPSFCDAKFLEVFHFYTLKSLGAPHITIHFSPKKSGLRGFSFAGHGFDAVIPNLVAYYLNTGVPSVANTLLRTSSIEFLWENSRVGMFEVECQWPIASYTLCHFIPNFTEDVSNGVTKLILRTGDIPDERVHKLSDTLRTLPELRRLSIHVGSFNAGENWGTVVNLESLETLSTQSKLVVELFGKLIVAPNLRCLHVSGSIVYMPVKSDEWQRTVSQAGLGAIRRVILENLTSSATTATSLLVILEGLVAIETLDLIGNFLSPIVSALTTRSLLSPALRTLVIRDSDIDGLILKQLLQSRRHTTEGGTVGKSIIRKVELDGSSKIDLTCCEGIKEMVETLVVTDRCHFVH